MSRKDTARWQQFIPGVIWFLIVLALMCTPGKDLPDTKLFKLIFLDKAVHFACFALLVILFYYPVGNADATTGNKIQYLTRLAIAGVLWGITTELIQRFYIPGRSFDWFDWLADSLGAIAAFFALRWRIKRAQ